MNKQMILAAILCAAPIVSAMENNQLNNQLDEIRIEDQSSNNRSTSRLVRLMSNPKTTTFLTVCLVGSLLANGVQWFSYDRMPCLELGERSVLPTDDGFKPAPNNTCCFSPLTQWTKDKCWLWRANHNPLCDYPSTCVQWMPNK